MIIVRIAFLISLLSIVVLSHNASASDYKSELIDDLQYLLSSEPTIDYEDPKLHRILNKYDYSLFKTYKAFIEFDRSNKSEADVLKAKNALINAYDYPISYWNDIWKNQKLNKKTIRHKLLSLMTHFSIENDMLKILPEERRYWDEFYHYKYIKIPFWLVKKHPNVVNHSTWHYGLTVNAKKSVRNIPEFNLLLSTLTDILRGYLTPDFGFQAFDSYLMTKHFIDAISFNPASYVRYDERTTDTCIKKPIKDRFDNLKLWANINEKNMLQYQEFLLTFDKASFALMDYYRNNYDLEQYADQAKNILSHYVCDHTLHIDEYYR